MIFSVFLGLDPLRLGLEGPGPRAGAKRQAEGVDWVLTSVLRSPPVLRTRGSAARDTASVLVGNHPPKGLEMGSTGAGFLMP